jgi:hypothetical protein
MTEANWLTATDPYDMLLSFPAEWARRKLWLYGCACVRRAWDLIRDPRTRACVEAAEAVVDGHAGEHRIGEAWQVFEAAENAGPLADDRGMDSHEVIRNLLVFVDPAAALSIASEIAEGVGAAAAWSIPAGPAGGWSEDRRRAFDAAKWAERAAQAALLRDVFGNPYRPPTFDPQWRSNDAAALAVAIYQDRAFDRLPLLSDALMDAGCDSADILAHCRDNGPHVRGCWVVDLVLGKE